MRVKQHMSWTQQKRWQKRYKGKLYGVSPRQLGCPPTKEGSRVAANAWWEAKKAAVDRETNLPAREWQDFIDGERELVVGQFQSCADWDNRGYLRLGQVQFPRREPWSNGMLFG